MTEKRKNSGFEHGRPTLKEDDINCAKKELQLEWTARMIGLMAHLTYWNVFGQFNKLPLDMYHRKQLFISIAEIKTYWEKKFNSKSEHRRRVFYTFIMPMIVLAIRVEIELIYKNSYPLFFSEPIQEKIAVKLINDQITELIDPNLYISRFSFYESGRDANHANTSNAMSKFYTRSALMQQLIPNPSEGKIRALFGTGKQAIAAKIEELRQKHTDKRLQSTSSQIVDNSYVEETETHNA